MATLDSDKDLGLAHLEGDTLPGQAHGVPGLSKDQFLHARDAAIAETRSPGVVLRENLRAFATILSVLAFLTSVLRRKVSSSASSMSSSAR
jgi:hypothetical protein